MLSRGRYWLSSVCRCIGEALLPAERTGAPCLRPLKLPTDVGLEAHRCDSREGGPIETALERRALQGLPAEHKLPSVSFADPFWSTGLAATHHVDLGR